MARASGILPGCTALDEVDFECTERRLAFPSPKVPRRSQKSRGRFGRETTTAEEEGQWSPQNWPLSSWRLGGTFPALGGEETKRQMLPDQFLEEIAPAIQIPRRPDDRMGRFPCERLHQRGSGRRVAPDETENRATTQGGACRVFPDQWRFPHSTGGRSAPQAGGRLGLPNGGHIPS